MRMKTYQAETLQEAFAAIKAEMGADAIILDTTHTRTGRTLLHPFGRPTVRVQAAVDRPRGAGDRRTPDNATRTADPTLPQHGHRAAIESVFDRVLATTLQEHHAKHHIDVRSEDDGLDADDEVSDHARLGGDGPARLRAELEARGCEPGTACRLMADVMTQGAVRRSQSDASLRTALQDVVTKRLRMRVPQAAGRGRARCVAVIGPTGSGKTLAVSKLTAQYVQSADARVTVAKLEPERTPVVDSLQITAVELGARLDIVRTPRELAALVSSHGEDDIILIDTPGRNVRDGRAVQQWQAWFSQDSFVEVHLVLPAQTLRQDFEDFMHSVAGVPVHRLLFSKLDETNRHGRILDIALRSALPVSYVTASQDARGAIEVATPDRLARLICGVGEIGEEIVAKPDDYRRLSARRPTRLSRMAAAMPEGGIEWNRP
ncbi:flagellar biosynthesis protein FlhF [Nitrospira sp.]|nr:flagellar biosynthesis protein FlhF [Nitrospira sp.]